MHARARRSPSTPTSALRWALTLGLAVALAGCASQQETYCDTLGEEQQTLADLSSGAEDPEDGVVSATIAVFERLQAEAPRDVLDEWDTYLTAWRALDEALAAAGADESMFEEGRRPDSMSREDYDSISAAAAALRSTRVVQAASGIEQHALDVCKIDLDESPLTG